MRTGNSNDASVTPEEMPGEFVRPMEIEFSSSGSESLDTSEFSNEASDLIEIHPSIVIKQENVDEQSQDDLVPEFNDVNDPLPLAINLNQPQAIPNYQKDNDNNSNTQQRRKSI